MIIHKREVVIILAVFFEVGLAPFSLLLGWLLGHPPLETFQWNLDAAVWGVVATIPLILMFLAHAQVADRPARAGEGVLRQRSRAAPWRAARGRTSP